MSLTRTLIAGLVSASLAGPAVAQCMQPNERASFDISALQSQLMVLALTCGHQEEYNRFMTTHRSVVFNAYTDVQRHFRRAGGPRAYDAYSTNAANLHSQVGISQGSLFCANQGSLFPAALSVRTRDELSTLSQERQIRRAYEPALCGAGTASTARGPRAERAASRPERPARPAQPRSTSTPRA